MCIFCVILSIFIFQSKAVRLHEQSNGNWNRSPAIPGPSGSSVNVSSGGLPKPIPARREEYSPGNFQHKGLLQNSHERYSYNSAPQYHNTPPPPSPPPPANYHTIRAGGSVKDSRPFTRGSGLKHRGRSGSRGKSSRGRGTPKKISALERLGPKVPEKGQSASSSSAFANEVNRTREDSNLKIVCPHCQFKTSTWAVSIFNTGVLIIDSFQLFFIGRITNAIGSDLFT